MTYEVFNPTTDRSYGLFPTLREARSAVRRARLEAYSIFDTDGIRVEHCEPYTGDDDRVKQAMGLPNASEQEEWIDCSPQCEM